MKSANASSVLCRPQNLSNLVWAFIFFSSLRIWARARSSSTSTNPSIWWHQVPLEKVQPRLDILLCASRFEAPSWSHSRKKIVSKTNKPPTHLETIDKKLWRDEQKTNNSQEEVFLENNQLDPQVRVAKFEHPGRNWSNCRLLCFALHATKKAETRPVNKKRFLDFFSGEKKSPLQLLQSERGIAETHLCEPNYPPAPIVIQICFCLERFWAPGLGIIETMMATNMSGIITAENKRECLDQTMSNSVYILEYKFFLNL